MFKTCKAYVLVFVFAYFVCVLIVDSVLLPVVSDKLSARTFVRSIKLANVAVSDSFYFGNNIYGLNYYLGFPLKKLQPEYLTKCDFKVFVLEKEKEQLIRYIEEQMKKESASNKCTLIDIVDSKFGIEKLLNKVKLVKAVKVQI